MLYINFSLVLCLNRLFLYHLLCELGPWATIDDVAFCNGYINFSQFFENLDTIPQHVLHLQVVDHNRLVLTDIFNCFLQGKARGVEGN